MTRNRVSRLPMGGLVAAVATLALSTAAVQAAMNVPSDGSDGALSPASSVEIDLSQAVTGQWDDNNAANAGKGVYDPEKWAVVFKYSSVSIPAGVTVTFKNRSPNAPVVWLVQGSVTIAGTVDVSGKPATGPAGSVTEGGPGGFRGGAATLASEPGSAGFGPGGGPFGENRAGAYGEMVNSRSGTPYGSATLTPLIGGSGSTAFHFAVLDGGSGGGAILIATGGTLTLSGTLRANGGLGKSQALPGSGGGVRLIADTLNAATSALVQATGSGNGRIRIEMNHGSFAGVSAPAASFSLPGATPVLWPTATQPSLKVTRVGDIVPPADPAARLDFPNQDVSLPGATPTIVTLQASNVPLDWKVYVRVVRRNGTDSIVNATLVSGNAASSVWQATITPAQGFTAIQARAYKP